MSVVDTLPIIVGFENFEGSGAHGDFCGAFTWCEIELSLLCFFAGDLSIFADCDWRSNSIIISFVSQLYAIADGCSVLLIFHIVIGEGFCGGLRLPRRAAVFAPYNFIFAGANKSGNLALGKVAVIFESIE